MGSFFTKHDCDVTHNFNNFYEIKANDIDGKEIDFNMYKNKVVIVCNVASDEAKKGKFLPSIAYTKNTIAVDLKFYFPCNQFNGQEPGDKDVLKQYYLEKMKIHLL